jgi:hypothetical protein
MKKLIFILILSFAFFSNVNAQTTPEVRVDFYENTDDLGGAKGRITKTHPTTNNTIGYENVNVMFFKKCEGTLVVFAITANTGEFLIVSMIPGSYIMSIPELGIIKELVIVPNVRVVLPDVNINQISTFPYF